MSKGLRTTLISLGFALVLGGCSRPTTEPSNRNATSPQPAAPAASPSRMTEAEAVPITLPVLDALFADESFTSDLKSKLQLTDEQIAGLRKIAGDEVLRLRQKNTEAHAGSTEVARTRAVDLIRNAIGAEKAKQLADLAREHWNKGSEAVEANKSKVAEATMSNGPNAVPPDTRIVVNAPAFRMDVFENGALVKSYKIGIGYPEFPLPTGLRKAQTIIFNPTWTPPDSPWVESMEDVTPGETVAAGSALNPLGPIKIPIGMPSLIHGGKPPSKIGTFASHGCVGLTNTQVRDFAKLLARAGGTNLSDQTIAAYAKNKSKTGVVKLDRPVPVELRYETIVVEAGKLHIYRDGYDQNTNTEENLRAVLQANGTKLEDLSPDEREQVMDALDAMSRHPNKKAKTTAPPTDANASPAASPVVPTNKDDKNPNKKRPMKNQKEIVLELAALKGKGYPAPMNLDTGTAKPKRAPIPTVSAH
jgi:L,D-transpeptidase ErfK/SrfK